MIVWRHRLIQNTAALLTGSGGSALLSLLLSILIGRVLGEEGLGIYAAVLAWIFPLSLVVEFGVGTLLIRQIAAQTSDASAYVQSAVKARLMLGGAMIMLIILAAPLLSDTPAVVDGLRISAPLVVINPFYGIFTAVFRAQRVMRPIAVLNIGMLASQVALTALVFTLGAGVKAALLVNLLTSGGQLCAAWWVWRWRSSKGQYTSPQAAIPVRDLLRRAMPFALASILGAVHLRAAFILLENLADEAAVGIFAAAVRFIDGGRIPPQAFFDALFPTLAARVRQPHEFRRTFRLSTLAVIAYGLLFALAMTFAASPLITLTYGADFAASAYVLTLLAWSLPALMLKYICTLYWYAYEREGFVNAVTVLVVVVQLSAGLLLIPAQGTAGAAWAVLMAECTGAAILSGAVLMRKPQSL